MSKKLIGMVVLAIVFVLRSRVMGFSDEGIFMQILSIGGIYLVGYGLSEISYKIYYAKPNIFSYWIIFSLLIVGSFFAYGYSLGLALEEGYRLLFYAIECFLCAISIIGYYFLRYKEKIENLV
ncbi:hypothetical protein KQ51_00073 [Candidatus Izimaplasma bacterium HR1]|uniref:hypothetical protein n=1 Tax=Candidatus Izimoplasma sp. HR1 TaxID=1541959 RepID=UPI0004F6A89C|nr:hypothetical protein KQ51_00073 [Candidatus Izimaplasma bacterium HR1]